MSSTKDSVEARMDRFEEVLISVHELQVRFEARMDRLEARMDRLEARMDRFEEVLKSVHELQVRFEVRMDRLEARMDGLEARMDGLEVRMDKLEARMDRFEEILQSVHESQVRIENEWRPDINAALEGSSVNADKNTEQDKRIDGLIKTTNNHSLRIIALEQKAKVVSEPQLGYDDGCEPGAEDRESDTEG